MGVQTVIRRERAERNSIHSDVELTQVNGVSFGERVRAYRDLGELHSFIHWSRSPPTAVRDPGERRAQRSGTTHTAPCEG